jgi:hypothetical protein
MTVSSVDPQEAAAPIAAGVFDQFAELLALAFFFKFAIFF